MEPNFILVKRWPSPEELIEALTATIPEFRAYWNQADNYFRDKGGSYSLHGVFSALTSFIRDQFHRLDEGKRTALFNFVEESVRTDPHSESGVSNAACTCFLEDLAGEGQLSLTIAPYLGAESKEYFDKWNQ